MPISSFLNEVTPICPSQINFEVEGSESSAPVPYKI